MAKIEALLTLLPDTPDAYPEGKRLVIKYGAQGVQVHDTRLVAAMNVHGVTQLLTINIRDFLRFRSPGAVHPSEIVGWMLQT